MRKIFGLKDAEPKLALISRKNTPPPLKDQRLVHNESVKDPQTPHTFGPTHEFPLNQSVLLFIVHGIAIETTPIFIKTGMNTLRKA